jgi:hypothetical protein
MDKETRYRNNTTSLTETFDRTNNAIFPCIWNHFTMVPVVPTKPERSFSIIYRIKAYWRTTMHEEYLSSSCLLYIHIAIAFDIDTVCLLEEQNIELSALICCMRDAHFWKLDAKSMLTFCFKYNFAVYICL